MRVNQVNGYDLVFDQIVIKMNFSSILGYEFDIGEMVRAKASGQESQTPSQQDHKNPQQIYKTLRQHGYSVISPFILTIENSIIKILCGKRIYVASFAGCAVAL